MKCANDVMLVGGQAHTANSTIFFGTKQIKNEKQTQREREECSDGILCIFGLCVRVQVIA